MWSLFVKLVLADFSKRPGIRDVVVDGPGLLLAELMQASLARHDEVTDRSPG